MFKVLLCMFLELGMRAAALVIFAWAALDISGQVGAAAWVFLATPILGITVGLLIGVWVDRLGGRVSLITGSVITITTFSTLAVFLYFGGKCEIAHLAIASSLSAIGGMVNTPALHGILQSYVKEDNASRLAAQGRTMISFGGVVGPLVGSSMLSHFGLTSAVMVFVLTSFFVLVLAITLKKESVIIRDIKRRQHPLTELSAGISYLINHSELKLLTVSSVLAMAVSNFSAALLPAFVNFELGLDSVHFGSLRGIWPVGAILGGIGASLFLRATTVHVRHAFQWIGGLGLATVAFSQTSSFELAALALFCSGFMFSVTRSVQDAIVLSYCDKDKIARVRSNISSLIHLSAIGIFFLSSRVSQDLIRNTFLLTGFVLVICAAMAIRLSKNESLRAQSS